MVVKVGDNVFGDTLIGADDESDSLSGRGGNDTLNALTVLPGGVDFCDGGEGFDTLVVNAGSQSKAVSLGVDAVTPTTYFVRSVTGDFFVDAVSIERVEIATGAGDDTINTGTAGGSIAAGDGIDHWLSDFSKLSGNMAYSVAAIGGPGGGAGISQVVGEDFITMITGSGSDTITGGFFGDTILTGAGDDLIDPVTRDPASGIDFVNAGAGFDTLDVRAQNETKGVSLSPDSVTPTTFFVRSATGNFFVDAISIEHVRFFGGSGDDFINSGTARIDINGSAGMDHWLVDASALKQNIRFDLGFTTAFPNSTGNNSTVLNVERITMSTGSGNDFIEGGAQGDTIRTGEGNDTVNAGTRNPAAEIDFVDLGDGFDVLIVNAESDATGFGFSPDSVTDTTFFARSVSGKFFTDAVGAERVEVRGGLANDTINTGMRGRVINGNFGTDHWIADYGFTKTAFNFDLASTHFVSVGGFGLVSVFNMERLSLTTGSGNDKITGGSEGDTIITGAGADIVNAGTRRAAAEIDVVNLGTGVDTLIVNGAAETQAMSFAPDSVTPTTFFVRSVTGNFFIDAVGVDRVIFTGGNGNDSINTGSRGTGINGLGGIDFWTADLSAVDANLRFTLGITDSLDDAGIKLIRNIEQITLTTGDGNDRITGGFEADNVRTGAGNDLVNLRTRPTGGGIDVADLGIGIDTLIVNAALEDQPVSIAPDSLTSTTWFVRSTSGNFFADIVNAERIIAVGGDGNDAISTGARAVAVMGNGGFDLWRADLSALTSNVFFNLGVTREIDAAGLRRIEKIEQIDLKTGSGNDVIAGGNFGDTLLTGDGNDMVNLRLRSPAGNIDTADLGAGFDTLIVDASAETEAVSIAPDFVTASTIFVRATSGRFFIDATNVDSVTFGGGRGNDIIGGSFNLDRLSGNAGNDIITGGAGGDLLAGGAGFDSFDYNNLLDSRVFAGTFDQIADFATGADKIDLATIDANDQVGGDQAFTFIFAQGFHGIAGELRVSGGLVEADINGDGFRDFLISVTGTVKAADIIL